MSYLLAMALLAGADPQATGQGSDRATAGGGAGMAMLDGQWQGLEMAPLGQRSDAGNQHTITIRNGTLTLSLDGRERQWRGRPTRRPPPPAPPPPGPRGGGAPPPRAG